MFNWNPNIGGEQSTKTVHWALENMQCALSIEKTTAFREVITLNFNLIIFGVCGGRLNLDPKSIHFNITQVEQVVPKLKAFFTVSHCFNLQHCNF